MTLVVDLLSKKSQKSYYLVFLLSVAFILLVTFLTYEKDNTFSLKGEVMGTSYKVVLVDFEDDNIEKEIFNVLNSVNQEMSTYINSSSISKLNNTNINEWVYVSNNFIAVALFSQKTCLSTEGMFDISVGNLVNYYGFGPPESSGSYDDDLLEEYKKEINCFSFEIDPQKKRIKRVNNVYLDMSAVAKGYAIDLLSRYLDSISINSYLIELGGEVKLRGHKSSSQPWVVGIENPGSISAPLLTLSSKDYKDLSLATSGEYRNFKSKDGIIVSHTIDPTTLKPLKRKHLSVSVLAENTMKADALATALNVMGLEQGLKYSNIHKIRSVYILKENENYILKTSKWF